MSKDIQSVSVGKDSKVTLVGKNRKGQARKQTFVYNEISKDTYTISAGRGMQITSTDAKHLKLGLTMQNGKMLYLLYKK